MTTVRGVSTDADFAAYRALRMAVAPEERAPTVEQTKAMMRPGRLLLLASDGAEVVGSGLADNSDMTGTAVVAPRVLPSARRRGVGTVLLRALVEHAGTLGHPIVVGHADDAGSVAFAERFGFVEVDRQVEQVREIGAEPRGRVPDGVRIVSIHERPELWAEAYERVAGQAFQDMAVLSPVQATAGEWERDWMTDPEATFVAVADDGVIGCAGLLLDTDEPLRAENALTAVRREWRGRGVASALKRATLAWAAEHGLREVYTWTQTGNESMRRLNEHLGYVMRQQSMTMRASLPITF